MFSLPRYVKPSPRLIISVATFAWLAASAAMSAPLYDDMLAPQEMEKVISVPPARTKNTESFHEQLEVAPVGSPLVVTIAGVAAAGSIVPETNGHFFAVDDLEGVPSAAPNQFGRVHWNVSPGQFSESLPHAARPRRLASVPARGDADQRGGQRQWLTLASMAAAVAIAHAWRATRMQPPSPILRRGMPANIERVMLTPRFLERLELKGTATVEEVERQFRQVAKSVHPDHGGSQAAFKQLMKDYERARRYAIKRARAAS